MERTSASSLNELRALVERLRSPGGCPWDREQTAESVRECLKDEAYEVLDAIDSGTPEDLKEELGDLLFQILFLARIAEETGEFDIDGGSFS